VITLVHNQQIQLRGSGTKVVGRPSRSSTYLALECAYNSSQCWLFVGSRHSCMHTAGFFGSAQSMIIPARTMPLIAIANEYREDLCQWKFAG
jgi:hypothetical protein